MTALSEDVFAPPIAPTPTVYSFYSPEVERVVQSTINTLNRTSVCAPTAGMPEAIHYTLKQNFDPGLDNLHLDLMAKYERFARSEGVIGLEKFSNKYFTNGSSEGIFHLLNQARMIGDPVYQLDGEYQGYGEYARSLDMDIQTLSVEPGRDDLINHIMTAPPGTVILSNPASKDGNIVNPNLITTILRRHTVILDLAYMGMTIQPLNIDLTQPGILGVVGSLSKPFGLYYYRVGFCYTRSVVPSLYGNKWFKNALSIRIGEAVLDHFASPQNMAAFKGNYFIQQEAAVNAAAQHFGIQIGGPNPIRASDVWLLANSPLRDTDPSDLKPFKRGEQNYRFCLTPYYMERRHEA